jgi:mandelamide amidase
MPLDEAISRNIAPGSTTGLPGLMLPDFVRASVTLEFDGPADSDRSLLTLGVALEAVFGKLPPPPIA